jgi:hypothetical protein
MMSVYQPESNELAASEGRFEPFDLTVNLGPDAVPWLSAASRVGFFHGIPRYDAALPPLSELLDHVYDYTDAVLHAERRPEPELARVLGELVFGDPMVLQLFLATRGVAADRGRQLLFRILAAPHLAVLPWELLPDPVTSQGEGPRYLALAPDTHLVRFARGRTYPARTTLLEAPLNLLLVLSSPTPKSAEENWLSFDIFDVKRALLAELAPLVQAGMLKIDVEDHPTLDNLRRRIGAQRRGYHLFHYVGHALPERLIIEDLTGQRRDLGSSQFMEVLRLCPDLRLAVFAGCETARAARDPATLDTRTAVGWRDLLSLADQCVQEACPAVIGMQAVLSFNTERVFTRFFYQALAHGYSTAEALRLARGAIQGDEHRTDDLLDWSVPALFVGNTDPGPLLPRSAAAPKEAGPTRSDLKLGLQQSNERFYGRDLPLRQAVEILAGVTAERVLVVTGSAGVGKTQLVDRMLEELDVAVTHVLYVPLDRLVPEVVQAGHKLDKGSMPDLAELTTCKPEGALDRLCRLVTELLGEGVKHPRDAAWSTDEWWERIVEDLVRHAFVLAIEDIDLLDHVQRGFLEQLIKRWLAERADADLKATSSEVLLDNRLELFSQLQLSLERNDGSPQSTSESLASTLKELDEYLYGLPDRLLVESRQVLNASLERLVAMLGRRVTAESPGEERSSQSPSAETYDPKNVIDVLQKLEQVREILGKALRTLAWRRSPVRIIITAKERPREFLDVPAEQVFEMRLGPLDWPETWRWIRSNLPALLSYGEDFLSRLWSRFGVGANRWEELERRVLQSRGQQVDLQKLAEEIAPRPAAGPASPEMLQARRGERALRIAVAGPNLAGPLELAYALTRLAMENGISGRVALAENEAGAWVTLINDEDTPFDEKGLSDEQAILKWLRAVLAREPDIILLDYAGGSTPDEIEEPRHLNAVRILLRSVHLRTLLIAAGGRNEGRGTRWVATPSAYPEVLGVGPLDNEGKLRSYAEWHPQLKKPDLFMADDLATSWLAATLKPDLLEDLRKSQRWGSSFSALHAVATATLVWSIIPELSPRAVWQLLRDASQPIAGEEPALSLKMEHAVALARRRAVERRLKEGPASLLTLGAMTGLNAQVLDATLRELIEDQKVVRLASGRLERYLYCGRE